MSTFETVYMRYIFSLKYFSFISILRWVDTFQKMSSFFSKVWPEYLTWFIHFSPLLVQFEIFICYVVLCKNSWEDIWLRYFHFPHIPTSFYSASIKMHLLWLHEIGFHKKCFVIVRVVAKRWKCYPIKNLLLSIFCDRQN